METWLCHVQLQATVMPMPGSHRVTLDREVMELKVLGNLWCEISAQELRASAAPRGVHVACAILLLVMILTNFE
jgi:hypothetical protein